MPQMSPMWWTMMITWMIICMMLIMYINYFNYQPKMSLLKKNNYHKMNWKW